MNLEDSYKLQKIGFKNPTFTKGCFMRFSRFILSVSAMLMLSACGSVHDDPSKHSDFSNWMNSRPSKIGEKTFKWPKGYAGQHEDIVRELRSADGSVSVFPVDDTPMAPAPIFETPVVMTPPASLMTQEDYGQMMLQLFYRHGSSALTAGERRQIVNVAKGAGSSPVALTVVGHASTRVDGVDDPVQKKIINFEMAQKRANAVTNVLTEAGVNPAWIQAVSKGDEQPNLVPGGRDQESADRRVEIYKK